MIKSLGPGLDTTDFIRIALGGQHTFIVVQNSNLSKPLVITWPQLLQQIKSQISVQSSGTIEVQDEGTIIDATAQFLNFVGAGVTVTQNGNGVDITIPGGGVGSVWGSITGTITNQTDLVAYVAAQIAAALVNYVPNTRTLTINGVTYDLSANRTWSVGTVTSVGATAPITSSGGATPTISTSMNTNKLIGRGTAGVGVMEEITLGTNLSLSGTTLNATGGGVTSVNSGININVDNTNPAAPIINSLSDRYKTTSTTSNSVSNGTKTFTVDLNLSYIPLQEILVVHNPANHMHGEVTSYNPATGVLVVDIKNHTGSGTYTSWTINLDGTPVDAITGSGTINEIAYFTASRVINSLTTATYPSLTELSYVKGVGSAIQTQINGKFNTPTGTTLEYVRGDGSLASFPTIPTGTVTSVSATVPSPASPALSVAVTNPTTTPAIAITANGTTAEYFRGDGSLATFPTSIPIIYKSVVDGTSITGIATEQISASQLIPANTFTVGDIIKLTWRIRKTGTLSVPTTKLYINTISSLVGAVQMGLLSVASNTLTIQHQRTLAIKSATNTEAFPVNVNTPTDSSWTTLGAVAGNIDWTVNQYIIFMCQIGTASADTIRTSFYLIEKV